MQESGKPDLYVGTAHAKQEIDQRHPPNPCGRRTQRDENWSEMKMIALPEFRLYHQLFCHSDRQLQPGRTEQAPNRESKVVVEVRWLQFLKLSLGLHQLRPLPLRHSHRLGGRPPERLVVEDGNLDLRVTIKGGSFPKVQYFLCSTESFAENNGNRGYSPI